MNKKEISIGNLSKITGFTVHTIRYYEKIGLLQKPRRINHMHRRYSSETVKRLLFIKNAKHLGFSLKEIKILLALKDQGNSCPYFSKLIGRKVIEIERDIDRLTKIRDALVNIPIRCRGMEPLNECPILNNLHEYL